MSRDFLLKTIVLLVAIGLVIATVFGFRFYDQAMSENDELREVIERQENQISLLESNVQDTSIEYQEEEAVQIQGTTETFINALFGVQQSTYADRRGQAESVVTQSMLDQYFPESSSDLELKLEFRIRDLTVYANPDGERATALVIMEGDTLNLANDQRDSTRTFVEVDLQKEGENWLVNEFTQIHNQPL